jgi:hypothetical protein
MRNHIILTLIMAAVLSACSIAYKAKPTPIGVIEGEWRITDKNYCPHICAMDDEQASSYKGRILNYSASAVSNGIDSCSSPTFTIHELTQDQFEAAYRFPPTNIGLTGQVVTEISVGCNDNPHWPAFGALILLKDSKTILTLWDGVFFEADRVK